MHTKRIDQALSALGVDEKTGVVTAEIANRRARYGANVLERAKQKSLIMRVLEAFCGTGTQYLRAYQWHPERLHTTNAENALLFADFIRHCI